MKKQINVSIIIALLLLGCFSIQVRGQSGDFIINSADATANLNATSSQALHSLIAETEPRFVVQFANSLNTYRTITVPTGLQTLLGQINPRFVIQSANSNKMVQTSYPIYLISDNLAPQISNVVVSVSNSAKVAWETDEFSDGEIRYGVQTGVYGQTLSDPLFIKQHTITITNIIPDTTYYFKIKCTDRSGNVAESSEYHFTAQVKLFLPLVNKR